MADENDTGLKSEAAATDVAAKVPAPKKQRAPRRQKAAAEATAAASLAKTAKVPSGRRKRGEQAGEVKLTAGETQVTGKSTGKDAVKQTGKKAAPKQTEQTVSAPVSAMDEMADLIQLEEENKRLRKTLADKLRAENADLRKRLGLD
ncbi:SyrB-like regulator [Rhizobium leguminosarum]|uniref:SyrB-like regulator n=1 Tax=Rhizobium leguminosarum TaxID=384 RepID=UPI003F9C12A9